MDVNTTVRARELQEYAKASYWMIGKVDTAEAKIRWQYLAQDFAARARAILCD